MRHAQHDRRVGGGAAHGEGPPARRPRLFTANREPRTANCRPGTVIVLVVAVLAGIALIATTMLVTSRYDQVGVQSWKIQNQIEMTFPMLEGYVRRVLTEDMWAHGSAAVSGYEEGNDESLIECYDAVDANHPWLNHPAGELVTWDEVESKGWQTLPMQLPADLKIRYCFLITDCNGLLNLNTHRRRDWTFNAPNNEETTAWAYNAKATATYAGRTKSFGTNIDGPHPEWGAFWYDQRSLTNMGGVQVGMGQARLGGGPVSLVGLDSMLTGSDSISALEAVLATGAPLYDPENPSQAPTAGWGRAFDLQDEFELRFPSDAAEGSDCKCLAEQVLPATLGGSGKLRRYFTAIARDANTWPRYEPPPMRPFMPGDPRIVTTTDTSGNPISPENWDKLLRLGIRYNVEYNDWFWENNLSRPIPLVPGVRTMPLYCRQEDDTFIASMDNLLLNRFAFPNGTYHPKTGIFLLGVYKSGLQVGPQYFRHAGYNYHQEDAPGRIPTDPSWLNWSILPYLFSTAMAQANLLGDGNTGIPYHADRNVAHSKQVVREKYRYLADAFLFNLCDAIDPGDYPLINSASIAHSNTVNGLDQFAGTDKELMGVEIEPLITEIVLNFNASGSLDRVAVELHNPYMRPVVFVDGTGSAGEAGWVYALRIKDDANSAIPLFPRKDPGTSLDTIPAGGNLVVYSGVKTDLPAGVAAFDKTASATGMAYPNQSAWQTPTLITLPRTGEIRLLRSGTKYLAGSYETFYPDIASASEWRWFVVDVARNAYGYANTPAAEADRVHGIADAFAAADAYRISNPGQPVAVRLWRPAGREGRSSFLLGPVGAWADVSGNLGFNNAANGDAQTLSRSFLPANMGAAPRLLGDCARIWRYCNPREDAFKAAPDDSQGKRYALTERIEQACLNAEYDTVGKPITDPTSARIWQKYEAGLYFSPWTPAEGEELTDCTRVLDFLETLTAAGCGWDGVDNNQDGRPDEHLASTVCVSYASSTLANYVQPAHFFEAANTFPICGKINVNTAPKAVLMCLNIPAGVAVSGGRDLREAIADTIIATRPHKSLAHLLYNTRTGGSNVGFDYFGFDGKDNHNADAGDPNKFVFPPASPDVASGTYAQGDRWTDPYKLVDDLDERNYLWRLNSEVLSTRSDTFAVYLRVQMRRDSKIVAERRVYSIWDRAGCQFAPLRQNGESNADFLPPKRLGIQIFSY